MSSKTISLLVQTRSRGRADLLFLLVRVTLCAFAGENVSRQRGEFKICSSIKTLINQDMSKVYKTATY